jgi:hypothetical protein
MSTQQIRYHDWNESLLGTHESYWKDIEDISFFISSALLSLRQNPLSRGEGVLGFPFPERVLSTIDVNIADQYYGACRVACIFASHEKVETSFSYNRRSFELMSENYQSHLSLQSSFISGDDYEKRMYLGSFDLSLCDYQDVCVKSDLKHFIRVYASALRLWPQYKQAILDGCCRPELLSSSELELEKYFDNMLIINVTDDNALIKKRYLEAVNALGFSNIRFFEEENGK